MAQKSRWGLWIPPLPKQDYEWLQAAVKQFETTQRVLIMAGLRALERLGRTNRPEAEALIGECKRVPDPGRVKVEE